MPPGALKKKETVDRGVNGLKPYEQRLKRYIGNQVGLHRKLAGLTLSELSEATDVPISKLSKIERGYILPSIFRLQCIAQILNRPLAHFIPPADVDSDCKHVKAGQEVQIRRGGPHSGTSFCQLGYSDSDNLSIEISLVTLSKLTRHHVSPPKDALILVYMLTGKASYRRGEHTYFLESGDTLLFNASTHHELEELIESPISYLSIAVQARHDASSTWRDGRH